MTSKTEATVMYGETARVGDRVKHFAQRWTGEATATIVGFAVIGADDVPNPMGFRDGWVKVVVDADCDEWRAPYWDWDRTELAPPCA